MSQTRLQRFQNYAARSNTNIRWAIAHGKHTNAALLQSFRIPDGVYISFVSEPGRLLSKNIIYHPTFIHLHRSMYLTKRFIKREIPITHLPYNLRYFYGNSPRIYFPGEYVPNIELEFKDPLNKYATIFIGVKSLKKHSKGFINTRAHLSDILTSPGIYFIIACRETLANNRTRAIQRQESSLATMLRKRPRNNTSVRRTDSPSAKRRVRAHGSQLATQRQTPRKSGR